MSYRKKSKGEYTALKDVFMIYLNMNIPLDTTLKTSRGEILHLHSVRHIVDMDGHIIAIRCTTVE